MLGYRGVFRKYIALKIKSMFNLAANFNISVCGLNILFKKTLLYSLPYGHFDAPGPKHFQYHVCIKGAGLPMVNTAYTESPFILMKVVVGSKVECTQRLIQHLQNLEW